MDNRKLNLIRGAILAVSIVFIAVGAFRGENADVYKKATTICLACMGIAK